MKTFIEDVIKSCWWNEGPVQSVAEGAVHLF